MNKSFVNNFPYSSLSPIKQFEKCVKKVNKDQFGFFFSCAMEMHKVKCELEHVGLIADTS